MPLEQGTATYRQELPNLMAGNGKYVVLGGDRVVGLYDTYDDALDVGYDTFGPVRFLVKQIGAVEPVYRFTRPIPVTYPT